MVATEGTMACFVKFAFLKTIEQELQNVVMKIGLWGFLAMR
jgi:hypothetical protein